MEKLYRFLKKANAMKEEIQNPSYGLQLDMQPDLDALTKGEVIKATNTKELPGIFDSIHEGQRAISERVIRKLSVSANFPSDSFPRMFKFTQNVSQSRDIRGKVKSSAAKKKRTT